MNHWRLDAKVRKICGFIGVAYMMKSYVTTVFATHDQEEQFLMENVAMNTEIGRTAPNLRSSSYSICE